MSQRQGRTLFQGTVCGTFLKRGDQTESFSSAPSSWMRLTSWPVIPGFLSCILVRDRGHVWNTYSYVPTQTPRQENRPFECLHPRVLFAMEVLWSCCTGCKIYSYSQRCIMLHSVWMSADLKQILSMYDNIFLNILGNKLTNHFSYWMTEEVVYIASECECICSSGSCS